MTNTVEVHFKLTGDFEPDALTARCGLKPTKVFRKGEPRKRGGAYEFSMWKLSVGWTSNDVLLVDEITDKLLDRLEPISECIANSVKSLDLYAAICVVLHVSTDAEVPTPAIGFSKRVVAFLHRVGAEIDIDLYRGS